MSKLISRCISILFLSLGAGFLATSVHSEAYGIIKIVLVYLSVYFGVYFGLGSLPKTMQNKFLGIPYG